MQDSAVLGLDFGRRRVKFCYIIFDRFWGVRAENELVKTEKGVKNVKKV